MAQRKTKKKTAAAAPTGDAATIKSQYALRRQRQLMARALLKRRQKKSGQ
jgi:hypothetical protein